MDAMRRPSVDEQTHTAGEPPAPERPDTAEQRDIAGQERDLEADARDRSAELRDRQAHARDELSDKLRDVATRARPSSGRAVIVRAGLDRQRAAQDRAHSAGNRALAAEDRARSTHERLLSARDRAAAVAEQARTETDDLTGVLHRRPGLAMLRREVDRAHRSNSALTAVFVDVEVIDDVVHLVAGSLLASMRSYDVVIRVSGDEFVCAMGSVTSTAHTRLTAVKETLLASGITISVGYAELTADDTPATLIDRAAADMLKTRNPPAAPPPP
jgi:diguanylate cyclase (GGDEF)-like protein